MTNLTQPRTSALPMEPLALSESRTQYYALTGKGENVVVLVHGSPGTHRDFRYLAPFLEKNARVLHLDLPGFGKTPTATAPKGSTSALADAVLETLDTLQLSENILLLGHSFGGHVVMEMASRRPKYFKAIVLLAAVGFQPHVVARPLVLPTTVAKLLDYAWIRPILGPLALFLFKNMLGFPSSTTQEDVINAYKRFLYLDYDEFAEKVTSNASSIPALLFWAKDDRLVEPAIGEELASAFGQCTQHEFASGGHNIQKTHAETIATKLVEHFIDK